MYVVMNSGKCAIANDAHEFLKAMTDKTNKPSLSFSRIELWQELKNDFGTVQVRKAFVEWKNGDWIAD